METLAVTAAGVESYQAPPAIFLFVYLHFQIPTAYLLTHSYKQAIQFVKLTSLSMGCAYLATEWAHVFGMLSDFELLDDLSEGSTVAGAILSTDSYLLSSLCHYTI